MEKFLERYHSKITGALSTFDRQEKGQIGKKGKKEKGVTHVVPRTGN